MNTEEYEIAKKLADKASDEDLYRIVLVLMRAGFATEAEVHQLVMEAYRNRNTFMVSALAKAGVSYVPFAQAYYEEYERRGELPEDKRQALKAEFDGSYEPKKAPSLLRSSTLGAAGTVAGFTWLALVAGNLISLPDPWRTIALISGVFLAAPCFFTMIAGKPYQNSAAKKPINSTT